MHGTILAAKRRTLNKQRHEKNQAADRTVFSTDNNGYAGNERDETLVDQNLWDSEIAADDRIPDGIGEIGEDDRPVYDEEGYTHAPGE
ncbi:MAG: hypothetical protein V8Q31_08530 [Alistipes communis]